VGGGVSDQGALFDPPDDRKPWQGGPAPYDLYDGTPPHEQAGTSHEAAELIRADVNRLQAQAFAAIATAPQGLTDEEGIDVTGMPANTWRPRRRELELLGRIRYEGTRATRAGRRAKVWWVS
jgi:hypothetical protein